MPLLRRASRKSRKVVSSFLSPHRLGSYTWGRLEGALSQWVCHRPHLQDTCLYSRQGQKFPKCLLGQTQTLIRVNKTLQTLSWCYCPPASGSLWYYHLCSAVFIWQLRELALLFYPSNEQKSRTERNDSCDIKHRPHKFNKTEGKFTRSTKSSQPIASMRPLLRKKSWVAYSHVKNTFKLVTLYMCVYTYVYMYIYFWWFYF